MFRVRLSYYQCSGQWSCGYSLPKCHRTAMTTRMSSLVYYQKYIFSLHNNLCRLSAISGTKSTIGQPPGTLLDQVMIPTPVRCSAAGTDIHFFEINKFDRQQDLQKLCWATRFFI